MATTVIPGFLNYPKEAAIIGRLLAGYGELEFELAVCVAQAFRGDRQQAFRILFQVRGETQRISLARATMTRYYNDIGLGSQCTSALRAMEWCRDTRNRYSHSQWISDSNGLFFTNLEKYTKDPMQDIILEVSHIDESLLILQETYFCYCAEMLLFLQHESQVIAGKIRSQPFSFPAGKQPPPPHNPAKSRSLRLS